MVQQLERVQTAAGDDPGIADDRVFYALDYMGRNRGWISYSYEADHGRRSDASVDARRGLDVSGCTDADTVTRIAAESAVIQVRSPFVGLRNAKVRRGEAPWFGLFVQVLENDFNRYSVSRMDGVPRQLGAMHPAPDPADRL